ncbi:MAG: ABC transporter permease [Bacillales bacterium]|nr:ABC transporter permease [Bacillales bacterium]
MKTVQQLWKERLNGYMSETRKYLRYILNDHLLFVLIFGVGAGVYYYSQWVKTLDPQFPAPFIMALLLGAVLAWSPIYTYLKRADIVFLLPMEERLKGYFQKAILSSFIFQSYWLILFLAALMPMYVRVKGVSYASFFLWLAVLFILKFWNLYVRWNVQKFQEQNIRLADLFVRFVFNTGFLYPLFSQTNWLLLVIWTLILIMYDGVIQNKGKKRILKWETLVELEEKRWMAFYRFANLFTTVPNLEGAVKRRKWLDFLFNKIPYGPYHVYTYLFSRTFIRVNEYIGLFFRLTLIGFLLISFSQSLLFKVIMALLFIYLTGFQLFPLIRHHDEKIWMMLYPVSKERKKTAFMLLLRQCLGLQAFLFAGAAIFRSWFESGIVLGAAILFVFLFTEVYTSRKLAKIENL